MKKLKTVNTGEIILVDQDDYNKINKYEWWIDNQGRIYADPDDIYSKRITLHYYILDYPKDPKTKSGKAQVKHKDGNKFNNKRSNLEIIYRKGPVKFNCEICDQESMGSTLQKYCSKKCSNKASAQKNTYIPKNNSYLNQERNCEICNNIFQKKSSSHKYCSDECRKKATDEYWAKRRTTKPQEINCWECNQKVSTTNRHQKWCSTECRITFNKKNKKKEEPKPLSAEDLTTNFFPATKPRKGMLIIDRDGLQCAICGKSSYRDCVRLHVDHIMPWSKGGRDHAYNLITMCEGCNLEKSDFLLEEKNIENLQAEARRRNLKYGISDNLRVPNNRNYKKW